MCLQYNVTSEFYIKERVTHTRNLRSTPNSTETPSPPPRASRRRGAGLAFMIARLSGVSPSRPRWTGRARPRARRRGHDSRNIVLLQPGALRDSTSPARRHLDSARHQMAAAQSCPRRGYQSRLCHARDLGARLPPLPSTRPGIHLGHAGFHGTLTARTPLCKLVAPLISSSRSPAPATLSRKSALFHTLAGRLGCCRPAQRLPLSEPVLFSLVE